MSEQPAALASGATSADPLAVLRPQLASVAQHLTDSKDLRAAGDYNLDTWGWAGGLASLQHAAAGLRLPWAFHSASQSKQQEETGSGQDAKPSSLKEVLARSRSYLSPHCDAALAAAVGLSAAYEGGGCSGAVLPYADESALEALRGGIKQHIDASWSAEAVKQGVSHARTGNYEEAKKCYCKALELQPDNTDAYVARGAAYANEKDYRAAATDLRAALQIDASNTNANRYLKAVEERAKQAGVSLEASPPPLPPSTNQPPSTHDNTHAARHDSTHAARHDSIHAARHDQREGVHQGVERGRQQGGCEARGPKDGDGGRSERSAQKRRRSGERGSGSDTHTSSDESSSESDSDAGGTRGGSGAGVTAMKAALQAVLSERKSKRSKKSKHKKSKSKHSKHKRKKR